MMFYTHFEPIIILQHFQNAENYILFHVSFWELQQVSFQVLPRMNSSSIPFHQLPSLPVMSELWDGMAKGWLDLELANTHWLYDNTRNPLSVNVLMMKC